MTQLSGKDLDIAVGLANGWTIKPDAWLGGQWVLADGSSGMMVDEYRPSELWQHGGPLLDVMGCDLNRHESEVSESVEWSADVGDHIRYADTPLEALCKLYILLYAEKE